MRPCIVILKVPMDYLIKWVFFNNFIKSVVLCLHCQLLSLKWSISRKDELDCSASGVLHSDTSQNRIHHIHSARFSNALQYSMKRSFVYAYFNFEMGFKRQEHWINSQDSTATQSNSSCLEIDHFGETATGNVKLGQRFY